MHQSDQAIAVVPSRTDLGAERPAYETPTIREMSEADILSSFQLTQSMAVWWGTSH